MSVSSYVDPESRRPMIYEAGMGGSPIFAQLDSDDISALAHYYSVKFSI